VRELIAAAEEADWLALTSPLKWEVLLGGDIVWADYAYKREKAMSRLGELAHMLVAMGHPGLVLIFDETETIDQLWNVRSRLTAYSTLAKLCGLSATWCVFCITERFERVLEMDELNGMAVGVMGQTEGPAFVQAWGEGRFQVLSPPELRSRDATRLAEAVAALYTTAYDGTATDGIASRCVQEWSRNPSRNPRRLVRLLVHRLDIGRKL
jgi:hypothetical protein